MGEYYDSFPVNILETNGQIVRKPINFLVRSIKVWENQHCIIDCEINGVIRGNIVNDEMHVSLYHVDYKQYLLNELTFTEISLNRDRVLWSNDLTMGGYSPAKNVPAFLSLFYQAGELCKVQFSNQVYLIEFYGTSNEHDTYQQNNIKNQLEDINFLAEEAVKEFEKEHVETANSLLIMLYREVSRCPLKLQNINNYSIIGRAFLLMLHNQLWDDVDTIQTISSIAYLCISKAIKQNVTSLNLHKDRLLVLILGYGGFKYTVMSVLRQDKKRGWSDTFFDSSSVLLSENAIWQMQFFDMEKIPTI